MTAINNIYMKLKKIFSFSDKRQIWRLIISNTDKLIIETRDTEKKEVFFHCIDLSSGKTIFKKYQAEEKYWMGIEAVVDEKIYFHSFAKPNMPEHKKIFVFDILQQKMIWQNDDLAFLTIKDHKLYAFKKQFEGQDIYSLDIESGRIFEQHDKNFFEEFLLNNNFEKDYSQYGYPQEYLGNEKSEINKIINNEISGKLNIQNVDYLVYEDFLMFNYYLRSENNLLDNEFCVYNIDKKKKVISETINKNLNSFSPDSFFTYKNILLLLKNKNEIISYKFS